MVEAKLKQISRYEASDVQVLEGLEAVRRRPGMYVGGTDTRALHHLGNLSERDYLAYRTIFNLVVGNLPRPDLLIYLKAPVPVLMERIHQRGREMERSISADYLGLLETFYDEWMEGFNACPVLTIRTADLDFVHKPKHLDIVVNRIQDRLAGKEDVVFPTDT